MIKPISPKEARLAKAETIPDYIIESFNELIIKYIGISNSITIKQKEVMDLILSKAETDRTNILNNKWLDIEPVFEKEGWKVKYDKPSIGDSYEAYFTFTAQPH